jgi:hypothetical protein
VSLHFLHKEHHESQKAADLLINISQHPRQETQEGKLRIKGDSYTPSGLLS